jgi:hypothetical protein
MSNAQRSFGNIEDGFYISPAFLDKLSIHIAKNFMNLPKIKVPLILGIWGGKGQVRPAGGGFGPGGGGRATVRTRGGGGARQSGPHSREGHKVNSTFVTSGCNWGICWP